MNHCKTAHSVDPDWLEFTGENLPDRQDYWITDIDSVLRSRDGHLMLLELKRNGRGVSPQQRTTLLLLDAILKAGLKALHNRVPVPGLEHPLQVDYRGVHLLQLSGYDFETSSFTWDRQEISKEELIRKLSFEDDENAQG